MTKIIIGIHGLGNKPEKPLLENWWKQAMTEGLRSAGFNVDLPKFELVYWADILHEKPLSRSEKDERSPLYLEEPYVKGEKDYHAEIHDMRRRLVDFLGRQMNRIFLNEDYSLNYSFIADAIVSRYFRDMEIYYDESSEGRKGNGNSANALIKARLASKLEEYRNEDILLIGHSMGSIVAYDVQSFMVPKIRINTFITVGSPLGMPVVISKIASENKKAGRHSDYLSTPGSIRGHWLNFSDIFDKVAFNYRLSDFFSENRLGIKPIDYLVVNNYEINGVRNPHKSFGYLRTNEVAKALNNFISGKKVTVRQKMQRKIVRFLSGMKAPVPAGSKKKPGDQP